MRLDSKISLKALNTFGMEAEARYFVEAKTHAEVLTLLNYRNMIFMPVLVLGGGSNILFTKNFAGLIIHVNTKGSEVLHEDQEVVTVKVQAGESWDGFVQHCVSNGWAGLENLSLIPGTVGAAPIQNIGAYGVEVKDYIQQVSYVDITTGKHHNLSNPECRFGYRDSIFKHELKGKIILTEVTFKLRKINNRSSSAQLSLSYGNILAELESMQVSTPSIKDVRDAVCNIRRRKLPDPALIGNAGSFFKNPQVSKELLNFLRVKHPEMPSFPTDDEGVFKIPAAWLIEQCGWKGYRDGDAGVYPDQPLVLVNYGRATGAEILGLAHKIVHSVKEKFDITLDMEVNVF